MPKETERGYILYAHPSIRLEKRYPEINIELLFNNISNRLKADYDPEISNSLAIYFDYATVMIYRTGTVTVLPKKESEGKEEEIMKIVRYVDDMLVNFLSSDNEENMRVAARIRPILYKEFKRTYKSLGYMTESEALRDAIKLFNDVQGKKVIYKNPQFELEVYHG